jgi:hypothetical protein
MVMETIFLRFFSLMIKRVILPLTEAKAASRTRTPLAELAVRTIMFPILVLFWTAKESVGCRLETYSIFIDKLLVSVSH